MKATLERHRLNSILRKMSTAVGSAAPTIVTVSEEGIDLEAFGREAIMYCTLDASVKDPGAAEVMLRQMVSVVKSLPNGKVDLESDNPGLAISGGGTRVVINEGDELCGFVPPEPAGYLEAIDGELLRSSLGGWFPLRPPTIIPFSDPCDSTSPRVTCVWLPPTPSGWPFETCRVLCLRESSR